VHFSPPDCGAVSRARALAAKAWCIGVRCAALAKRLAAYPAASGEPHRSFVESGAADEGLQAFAERRFADFSATARVGVTPARTSKAQPCTPLQDGY
jgi:hypothetical protein